jgi:hypothetical protein
MHSATELELVGRQLPRLFSSEYPGLHLDLSLAVPGSPSFSFFGLLFKMPRVRPISVKTVLGTRGLIRSTELSFFPHGAMRLHLQADQSTDPDGKNKKVGSMV